MAGKFIDYLTELKGKMVVIERRAGEHTTLVPSLKGKLVDMGDDFIVLDIGSAYGEVCVPNHAILLVSPVVSSE